MAIASSSHRKKSSIFNDHGYIQLFGSEEQIELAIKIATIMTKDRGVPTQDLVALLQHLRSDLRLELDLPLITKDMVHLNAKGSA